MNKFPQKYLQSLIYKCKRVEKKKKKGVWERTEETPHKDAKEIIFFPLFALPQF